MIRVLHVDDQLDVIELTAAFLNRREDRFDVVTETSARAGLDRLAAEEIDCIVSDYQMPGMDGLELLTAVRETHPDLPFILFTGDGSEAVASEALSAGATEYLKKDNSVDQYALLANRITNAVESYRAHQQKTYLEHVHRIVRTINQALVRASSREEIEQRVCETIGSVDPVRFVAVSEFDPRTNRLDPRTWVGAPDERFTDTDVSIEEDPERPWTPHERAIYDREIVVSHDIRTDPAFDPWREGIHESDVRTLLVVPLQYDDTLYGLITMYTAQTRPIDEEVITTLGELGDNIAYAFNAIEARTALAEREASYRTLTETATDAIITIDATNTIQYANPAVEDLFGYTPAELQGGPLDVLMPDDYKDIHGAAVTRYLRTGERHLDWSGVELPGQHKDGTVIPLSISFGEFARHGDHYFTAIVRDITVRNRRTAELQRQNERLDEFTGIVAHDLRNPLNVVEGRVELAQDECDSEHLDIAAQALERTDSLIRELLTFARQGQPITETESVALSELVSQPILDEKPFRVEVDPALDPIVGHRGRVQQLFENLLRNAVEHGGDDVTIRIERLADGFTVEDDGPGIPAAHRDDVFKPGYTSKETGTGFGLNIVKTIVDAHGWEIEVTDGREGGARFEITGVDFAA